MQRWQQIQAHADIDAIAQQCYRSDIYRDVFADQPLPATDYKNDNTHAEPWSIETTQGPVAMGSDLLMKPSH